MVDSVIKDFLKSVLGDFVLGIEQIDNIQLGSSVVIPNLAIKTDVLNREIESTNIPFTVNEGIIGKTTVDISMWGTVSIKCENISTEFAFDPLSAASSAFNAVSNALGEGDENSKSCRKN